MLRFAISGRVVVETQGACFKASGVSERTDQEVKGDTDHVAGHLIRRQVRRCGGPEGPHELDRA